MAREIAETMADASLPRTPLTVRGKEYNLCFDLGALSEAETAINSALARANHPERVNLLMAMGDLNLSNSRIMFAAAVRKFHPELSFEQAREIPGISDLFRVVAAVEAAWMASTSGPELVRPREPGDGAPRPGE